MENKLLNALREAAQWQDQMTEYERTKITYFEAREVVIKRIYEKHNDIIKKPTIDECINFALNEVDKNKSPISIDSDFLLKIIKYAQGNDKI